jgi:hypothetical protein
MKTTFLISGSIVFAAAVIIHFNNAELLENLTGLETDRLVSYIKIT